MKKIMLFLSTIIILCIGFIVYRTMGVSETPIHYHANFAVFIGNTQVNFSDPSYMHLAPCLADSTDVSFNKLHNVHLHDLVGNVVHVHQAGVVWNDLFKSVKYDIFKKIDESKQPNVTYYINGKKVNKSVLNSSIKKEDKFLISIDALAGPADIKESEYFSKQFEAVGNNAVDYDNGTKGAEKCGASGKRSFLTRLKIALKTLNSDIKI